jgi:hypothetical protein
MHLKTPIIAACTLDGFKHNTHISLGIILNRSVQTLHQRSLEGPRELAFLKSCFGEGFDRKKVFTPLKRKIWDK